MADVPLNTETPGQLSLEDARHSTRQGVQREAIVENHRGYLKPCRASHNRVSDALQLVLNVITIERPLQIEEEFMPRVVVELIKSDMLFRGKTNSGSDNYRSRWPFRI